MHHLASFAVALAVAFNSVLFVCGVPGLSVGNVEFGTDQVAENTYENVISETYNIITSVTTNDGKCTKQVTATGNGIRDVFDLPCSDNGGVTITSKKILIYGNPKEDSFFLFSNKPSVLIAFQDGKCTKRKYKTVTRETFGKMSELSKSKCKKIKDKVSFIVDKEAAYLETLDKLLKEQTAQPSFKSTSDNPKTSYGSSGKKYQSQKSPVINPVANDPAKDLKQNTVSHQETPPNGAPLA